MRCPCPGSKSVFCFTCPTFNSTCPLGKLERTGRTSVSYHLSRKMCKESCRKCLLVQQFGRVNMKSHLSHREYNLSQTSGQCFSHPVTVPVKCKLPPSRETSVSTKTRDLVKTKPYSSLVATMEYFSREFNRFLTTRIVYEYSIPFRLREMRVSSRETSVSSRETDL